MENAIKRKNSAVKIIIVLVSVLLFISLALSAFLTVSFFGALGGTYIFARPRLSLVSGESMQSSIYDGDYLLVMGTPLTYTPKQGDIAIINGDFEGDYYDQQIVKRIIATDGQTVKIYFYENMDARVYVDGELYEVATATYEKSDLEQFSALEVYEYYYLGYQTNGEPLENASPYYDYDKKIYQITVPEGHCFVMGDNRYHSADSRINEIGCVPYEYVTGKVICKVMPFASLYNE